MSKKTIFSVLDVAATVYGTLFTANHVGEAVRAFTDQVNRADDANFLNKYPEHFALYEIGSFDDNSGVIESLSQPRLIVQASSVKIVIQ